MIPLKDDNPTLHFPLLTVALIAANVLAFGWELFNPVGLQGAVLAYGVVPAHLFGAATPHQLAWAGAPVFPQPLTLITSAFLHGGLVHLAGNMLFLWIFGNNVEDAMGKPRFAIFYLLCAVSSALAQSLLSPRSPIPLVGASGAIAGVLGAYLVLYPRAQVLTLVPLFIFVRLMYLPAYLFIGIWFFFQVLAAPGGGPVAYAAHIAGFLVGLGGVRLFARRPRLRVRDLYHYK